jgi:Tol biopolymer transport system component
MPAILFFALFAFAADDSGTIRLTTVEKILEFSADGTKKREAAAVAADDEKTLSPDGKQLFFARDGVIVVTDRDGKHALQVSPTGLRCAAPYWSPDGKQIAFLGLRGDHWQLHTVDPNGKELQQVTDWPAGVQQARYSPGGQLSYLRMKATEGKFQEADLMVIGKEKHEPIIKEVFVSDYAWSPDGKTVAYGKLHALVFLDVATGKSKEIAAAEISDLLFHHAPTSLAWNPDGTAVVCRMPAHVGRAATLAGEPPRRIFGDDEVFVIPRAGKPYWFVVGDVRAKIEWLK